MNIFPGKFFLRKYRDVLKWIEHILAIEADKYGVKALEKR